MAQASDYPVTFAYGATDGYYYGPNGTVGPYHRGDDRAMPTNTPVIVNGVQIGLSGSTGASSGPHLHIGRWVGGADTNPNKGGFGFGSAVIHSTGTDAVNGNYVRISADGALWVYLHLNRIDVRAGQVLNGTQGGSMSQTDLGIARVLAHGILGRNQSPNNALAGECDADLNRNHVGKETNAKIWEFYNSAEGKAWRDQRYPAILAENATLKANIGTVTADRDQLIKKLDDANKQIDAQTKTIGGLQQQLNDAQKEIAALKVEVERLTLLIANQECKPIESYSITELIGAILRKLIGDKK